MKELELTANQKTMLIEMCKALYPEFQQLWGYKMVHDYMKEHHPDKNTSLSAMETRKLGLRKPVWLIGGDNIMLTCHLETMVCMHWFEFCIYHLCDKLREHLLNTRYEFLVVAIIKPDHPVDYLYKQFKYIQK